VNPALRRFALTLHVVSSVGWLGLILAYVGILVAGLIDQRPETVAVAYYAMEMIGWFVIVPLAVLALVTGVIQSLGTAWGLLRHYWVVYKLVLIVIALGILLLNMPTVSTLAAEASNNENADLSGLWSQLLHAGGGIIVLLTTTVLGIYKPRGRTPFTRPTVTSMRDRHSNDM
jgi:hypothetical protein